MRDGGSNSGPPHRLAHAPSFDPRSSRCAALSRCDLFRLARTDLLDLFERFEHAKEELGEALLETVIKHKAQRYFSLRISINEARQRDSKLGTSSEASALLSASDVHGAALRIQQRALALGVGNDGNVGHPQVTLLQCSGTPSAKNFNDCTVVVQPRALCPRRQ